MIVQNYLCQSCAHTHIRPDVRGKRPNVCPECNRPTLVFVGKSHNSEPVPEPEKNETPKPEKRKRPAWDEAKYPLTLEGEHTHARFRELAQSAHLRQSVYLKGPAGSGKTYAAEQVARLLNLDCVIVSGHEQMSAAELVGFHTIGDGTWKRGLIEDTWRNGGVFLIDEGDRAPSEVLVALNALAAKRAGESYTFDGEMVPRHADTIILMGGNTDGTGTDDTYTAGTNMDASILDRFGFIEWDYDEVLERQLGVDAEWTQTVLKARKALKASGLDREKFIITPRATIEGGKALQSGVPLETVERMWLHKAMSPDHKATLAAHM